MGLFGRIFAHLFPTPGPLPVPVSRLVGEYSNAVGRYGPDSDQAREFRRAHAGNAELMEYADALDRLKRRLGGSGIDRPAR